METGLIHPIQLSSATLSWGACIVAASFATTTITG